MREWRSRFRFDRLLIGTRTQSTTGALVHIELTDGATTEERWRRHGAWTATGPNARKAMAASGAGSARLGGRPQLWQLPFCSWSLFERGGFEEWGAA